jgi:hypothetical protein
MIKKNSAWKKKGNVFVQWAENNLWLGESADVELCLRAFLGLSEEAIRTFHIGWNPDDYLREPSDWGMAADGEKIWLPKGVVIPYFDLGKFDQLRRIAVRRYDDATYTLIAGSSREPIILGENREAIVVVEHDLDAILLNQEIGDMAGVMALSGEQIQPDSQADAILKDARSILISFCKPPGDFSRFPQSRLWLTDGGENLAEMWRNDKNLMEWVAEGIAMATSPEPVVTAGDSPWAETARRVAELERLILARLDGQAVPIVVSSTCLIHDIAEYARGAAVRIITGGDIGKYDREILRTMGIDV